MSKRLSLRWAADPRSWVALAGVLALLPLTVGARAVDNGFGAWLETSPIVNWNTPGAPLPQAPADGFDADPRCGAQERPPESPEEDQVVAAGWRLFTAARVGWGLREVDGLVGYDGMCRPMGFHGFIFADGQFVGTISPDAMSSRTDGAGRVTDLRGPANLTAHFVRYTPADPLCCPSSNFTVDYKVDRTPAEGPVLVPLTSTRNT